MFKCALLLVCVAAWAAVSLGNINIENGGVGPDGTIQRYGTSQLGRCAGVAALYGGSDRIPSTHGALACWCACRMVGYITVNGSYEDGAHLFYWMFESRNDPATDPLV